MMSKPPPSAPRRSASVTWTPVAGDRRRVVAAQAQAVERRHRRHARPPRPARARACWRLRRSPACSTTRTQSASPAEVTQLFLRVEHDAARRPRWPCRPAPRSGCASRPRRTRACVRCAARGDGLAHVGGAVLLEHRGGAVVHADDHRGRAAASAICSTTSAAARMSSPSPPTSLALIRPSRPALASASRLLRGNWACLSTSAAEGAMTSATTSFKRCRWGAVSMIGRAPVMCGLGRSV